MKAKRKVLNFKKSVKTTGRIGIVMGIIVSLVVANVLFTMITGVHLRSGENVLAHKSGSGSSTETIVANRGYIRDFKGEIIAQDVESYDVIAYVDKSRINATKKLVYVVDADDTARKLAEVISADPETQEKAYQDILNKITEAQAAGQYQTNLGSYSRNLTADQKKRIEELELPGLDFEKSVARAYPTGHFASQLVGYTNYDDDRNLYGVSGLEAYFNKELTGKNGQVSYQTDSENNRLPDTQKYVRLAENGNDVWLTIDYDTQLATEKALADTMESNKAKYAWCIVMDIKTGRIIAQAGYPTFDLNTRENITNSLNVPSEFPFEVGSVMKTFVYAAAMNEGKYVGSDTFKSGTAIIGQNENGLPVRNDSLTGAQVIGTVSDALGKDNGIVTFDQGFIYSLNTGIASLITNYISPTTMIEYMKKFKLFEPLNIYGLNEVDGTLNENHPFDIMSLGFGQASTVNTYQLLRATSAIVGDGTIVEPYIVEKITDSTTGEATYQAETKKGERVISEATAKQMQHLMQQVVEDERGTASQYKMSDVKIIAKTGTGQMYDPEIKGYSPSYYTSGVIAAAPADDPQILIYYGFQSENFRFYSTDFFKDIVRESLQSLNKYTESSNQTTENNVQVTDNYVEYTMPSLVNHSLDYVNRKLDGFKIKKQVIGDGTTVIEQFPLEGEKVSNAQNTFLLTDGANITMPDMNGWSRRDVSVFANMTGLNVTFTNSGNVSGQSIAPGSAIVKGANLEVELK
ncbi:penicillin-binding protein 2B [Breznakia blatticola]|uniref:Penicillin-binding protein 2B n=1 Tax=Breznakia blatticola TaxID=1754012 RepID=A0A4R7ZEX7_9FIRM|nr:penicillin-binding transpeptidase domain-containing protein [Breznakia blatticola]TDW14748.1 penicillin-binding protein 2B [Breznakia blatticola]